MEKGLYHAVLESRASFPSTQPARAMPLPLGLSLSPAQATSGILQAPQAGSAERKPHSFHAPSLGVGTLNAPVSAEHPVT